MNTPTTPQPAGGAPGPKEAQGTRRSRRSWDERTIVTLVLLAVAVFAVYTASDVVRTVISRQLTVTLEAPNDTEGLVRGLPGTVHGLVSTRIPLSELSTWAVTHILIGQIVIVIGVCAAGWYVSRALRTIGTGRPYSQQALRSLVIASWVISIGGTVAGLNLMLGGNLVIRDLDLADAGFNNGVTTMMVWGWGAALGIVQLFYQALRRGRDTEAELEGVI